MSSYFLHGSPRCSCILLIFFLSSVYILFDNICAHCVGTPVNLYKQNIYSCILLWLVINKQTQIGTVFSSASAFCRCLVYQSQGLKELFHDKCEDVISWLNGTAFTEGWALYAENPLIATETNCTAFAPYRVRPFEFAPTLCRVRPHTFRVRPHQVEFAP